MTAEATPASSAPPVLTGRFFTDDDFDFNARFAISKANQGVFDLGVAVQTLGRITDGDPESWLREWTSTADRLHRQAAASDQAGQDQTAAWFYLGAADAYARAVAFIDGLPDERALLPTFRRHRSCWEAFIDASRGNHLRVDIPYQGTTLPGYLFRPDSSGAVRPTLVITNGSDGSLSGLWGEGIKAGLTRGWNVFVFDGPGQQSALFEQGIPFRHDWEQVLTPVLDALVTRSEVDGKRLLALGISQGGYWLPRALAFEHRFVAAVVDDGVWDVSRGWYANLAQPLVDMLRAGERDRFNQAMSAAPTDPVRRRGFRFRARPYGTFDTPYDLFRAVGRYRLADVVGQICTPMLICDPDDEAWFAGQPRELYDALSCEKELVHFSREDGANYHCEPWARDLVAARTCDFSSDTWNWSNARRTIGIHLDSPDTSPRCFLVGADRTCALTIAKNGVAPGVPAYNEWVPRKEVETSGVQLADAFGCQDSATAIACLREKPTSALATSAYMQEFGFAEYGIPSLPDQPGAALTAGHFHRVPVIDGTNRDEMRYFVDLALSGGFAIDSQQFEKLLVSSFGSAAGRVESAYPESQYPSPALAWAAVLTDASFSCSALTVDQTLASHVPTYAYEFADEQPPDWEDLPAVPGFPLGAAHSTEIAYLFSMPGVTLRGAHRRLSNQMIDYWSQFARSGNPNSAVAAEWPRFTRNAPTVQILAPDKIAASTAFQGAHHCQLWNSFNHSS